MSITKEELSEYIRDVKFGGDPAMEGKLHPTIIWKTADIVIGGMIEAAMFKTKDGNGYDLNGEFISTYNNVEVKDDSDTGEQYSDLPAPLISLKNNRGLHRVSEMKNIYDAFSLVPNGSNDIFSILDVHYLNKKTEVYVQGDRIYYRNLRPTVDKVLIKMVAGISALALDEPIPVPAIMEEEFIQRVSNMLTEQKVTPQDKTNDSNPNIPTG